MNITLNEGGAVFSPTLSHLPSHKPRISQSKELGPQAYIYFSLSFLFLTVGNHT